MSSRPSRYLLGYAPALNRGELVWSQMKSTGLAQRPLRRGDQLQPRIDIDLCAIQLDAKLVRSFVSASPVAYIADVRVTRTLHKTGLTQNTFYVRTSFLA